MAEKSYALVETNKIEVDLNQESEFDGKTIQLIGWTLLGYLVTICTLGILYSVAYAWIEGWKINHRIINGKSLCFDGNGFQLLGRWILWWLLSIVTFGIFLLFVPVRFEKWLTKHTHFVDETTKVKALPAGSNKDSTEEKSNSGVYTGPSALSIVAFILSLTFFGSMVGLVLGIIAMATAGQRRRAFALLAIIFGAALGLTSIIVLVTVLLNAAAVATVEPMMY